MECNKEEAIRAKGIAEKKMENKDFVGARRIAIKAQQLYPDLENISQMISVCDVHCLAAENSNLGKDKDWYGILKVEQSADQVSIKKQFRKLALVLHPDKNRFAGSEAAFILIEEAQTVLLDSGKRFLFDAKYRPSRTPIPRPPTPSAPPRPSPFGQYPNNVRPPPFSTPSGQSQNNAKPPPPPSSPSGQNQNNAMPPPPNNARPPSDQNNASTTARSYRKRQPKQQASSGHDNAGQNDTPKNAPSYRKKQPKQQASSDQDNAGQNDTPKNAPSYRKKQPKQQAPSSEDRARPPSGKNDTPETAQTYVEKQQPQQQAPSGQNSGKPPKGRKHNTTKNASYVEKKPQKQAHQGNNASKTADCAQGDSNGRSQGNSKPGVDSFAKSRQSEQAGMSKNPGSFIWVPKKYAD